MVVVVVVSGVGEVATISIHVKFKSIKRLFYRLLVYFSDFFFHLSFLNMSMKTDLACV